MKILLKTLHDTKKIAEKLANEILPPALILLKGELGSGKTTFTQFFAEALGYKGVVSSPTFALHQFLAIPFKGKMVNLHHLDLYRIPKDTAWHELFYFLESEENFLAIIEWGDKVEEFLENLNYPTYSLTFFHHPHGRLLEIAELCQKN